MNLLENLTPQQLRQAAEIKEQIESLETQLSRILGGAAATSAAVTPRFKRKRKVSAEARARMSAAQKRRRAAEKGSAQPEPKTTGKRKMSAASKAKLSERMKDVWAKRRTKKS